MTLVVEDGSGLSNAMSLASVAFVTAYWSARGGNTAWDALAVPDQEARAAVATDYLLTNPRYQKVRGRKLLVTQRLMWPRLDATEMDGTAIPSDSVPLPWQEAVAILAPVSTSLAVLLPTLARGGRIASEALTGVGSVTYADDAPVGEVIQSVDGLLARYLRIPGAFDMSDFDITTQLSGASGLPVVFDSEYGGSGAVDDASSTS